MPEGWAWCRFGNFIDVRDGTHYSPKYVENGYPFVTSKNLVNGKIDFTDVKYISEKDHKEYIQRSFVEDGDILFAMIGSIGNPVLVKKDREFSIKNVALFKPYSKQLTNMKYLFYFLLWIQENLRSKAKGGMQPFIPLSFFRTEVLIPIPPSEEQFRIISNIEEILSKIDSLEKNKIDLENIIKQTKSKILDLAIHGKLVPQDPNDEPAEELLKRIATSDNRPYKKIDEDEVLFDIPESWSWCTLGEIYTHTTGKALKKTNNKGTLRKYITTSNLYWNTFDFTEVREMYFTDDELEKCTIKKGDLILCNGGDVGRAAIWNYNYDICYQNHVSRLRPKDKDINNSFFLYLIMIYKQQGMLNGKGVGITSLSASDLLSAIVPLPPYSEQKRIVEKIECLYGYLTTINNQL